MVLYAEHVAIFGVLSGEYRQLCKDYIW